MIARAARISPDLPVCESCLAELFDPRDRRYHYPYINCTNCGPRYTVIMGLPYDRSRTTMQSWPLDEYCAAEYHDPGNRRFHAQPVACPACGPHYELRAGDEVVRGDEGSVRRTAVMLTAGRIVAIKGLGGYHLACDATECRRSAWSLRERKYRKEKPFALMAKNIEAVQRAGAAFAGGRATDHFGSAADCAGSGPSANPRRSARQRRARRMALPYAPLQHLLFAAGAPRCWS